MHYPTVALYKNYNIPVEYYSGKFQYQRIMDWLHVKCIPYFSLIDEEVRSTIFKEGSEYPNNAVIAIL